jgi:hypothetical protein
VRRGYCCRNEFGIRYRPNIEAVGPNEQARLSFSS